DRWRERLADQLRHDHGVPGLVRRHRLPAHHALRLGDDDGADGGDARGCRRRLPRLLGDGPRALVAVRKHAECRLPDGGRARPDRSSDSGERHRGADLLAWRFAPLVRRAQRRWTRNREGDGSGGDGVRPRNRLRPMLGRSRGRRTRRRFAMRVIDSLGIEFWVMLGLMVLVVALLSSFLASLYRKAGPHEALIVYGFRGTRIVKGHGTVIFPMIESFHQLSLELMSFD